MFNPETQLDKFDKDRSYSSRWLAEPYKDKHADALSYFDAIPRHWNMRPDSGYPSPIVPADKGRARALDAYENRGF